MTTTVRSPQTDQDVQREILEELDWTRVPGAAAIAGAGHATVQADGTDAALAGAVRSFAARSRTSPHVTAVRNRIVVRA